MWLVTAHDKELALGGAGWPGNPTMIQKGGHGARACARSCPPAASGDCTDCTGCTGLRRAPSPVRRLPLETAQTAQAAQAAQGWGTRQAASVPGDRKNKLVGVGV